MSPTLLWTFDWATLGLRRHLWSTTTSTRCGMRNSELRFVIKAEKCAWHIKATDNQCPPQTISRVLTSRFATERTFLSSTWGTRIMLIQRRSGRSLKRNDLNLNWPSNQIGDWRNNFNLNLNQVEIATQHLINGQQINNWFPILKGQKVTKQKSRKHQKHMYQFKRLYSIKDRKP